ncbi:lipoprotein NlpI [Pseudoalteromonas sp. H105]|uniref:lipoprotein NlpI n=1 Tax=Pseudoalteromonas sp. H105 TaxID=1348393 RepID=UPI00073216A7|nr:lipoprotein NlpI [Pseudoalteromonas sp. H105]KTF13484.1 lipoprotein NlpI [Pseudoalteromonas sp. H105]
MTFKHVAFAAVAFFSLSACQTTTPAKLTPVLNVPFSAPLASDFRSEIAIARHTELLKRADLTTEQQAMLYYDRGMLFDSLGMSTLAHYDFNRAVKMKPDLAEVYNFLGIHHTLMQQYEKAYESFDSALELNEQHQYAYLNRGIALYYGERHYLATQDFKTFVANSAQQPFPILWQYLAQSNLDKTQALIDLKANAQGVDETVWGYQIIALFLGEIAEDEFLAGIVEGVQSEREYTRRLCEAYFYLAKIYQAKGELNHAVEYFRLALATNVHEYIEYKYARLELELMTGDNAS